MKPQIQQLLFKAQAYLGVQGGSPAHHALIDAYNAVQPLPVGYAVTYDDAWAMSSSPLWATRPVSPT